MSAPQYQVLVAYTRTGQVVDALDQAEWSFDDHVPWADNGKMTVTLPLPGRDEAGAPIRNTLRSIASAGVGLTLALVETLDGLGPVCLWAGPVISPPAWDSDTVKIGCGGLGKSILDRRVLVANGHHSTPNAAGADLTFTLLPEDLVLAILAQVTTGTGRGLPITIPAQSGRTGPATVYKGSELKTGYEAIKTISEADGGPDVMLVPQITPDQSAIYWDAIVRTPIGYPNPDAVWSYPLFAASGDSDDSATVDTAYVPGGNQAASTATGTTAAGGSAPGAAQDRLIGVARNPVGPIRPALEGADRTSTSETRQAALNALARSYADQYARPVEGVDFTGPMDDGPRYRRQWNLGDTLTFAFTGHPWLDDQEITRRAIGISGTPASVKFTTAGGPL